MKNRKSKLENILNEPSYWIENVNGILYDSILNFMEENNMNRSQLASHLELSKGRISQILNDGEINFSMKKVVEISLKIGTYPQFTLINKDQYLDKNIVIKSSTTLKNSFSNETFEFKVFSKKNGEENYNTPIKTVRFGATNTFKSVI